LALTTHFFIWTIIILAVSGVAFRPWNWPEAIWPGLAVLILFLSGLLPGRMVFRGIAQGEDVYLFLAGMMLLAALAHREGLFDWLAAHAAMAARGSAQRLFGLVYLVGVLVTIFLSNDATAVVLTPAVAAVTRAAGVGERLPYLLACAFIANAASFVLPISNPANLVVFGGHMPPLAAWLARFTLPSLASIIATYLALRWTQRRALVQPVATKINIPVLSASGRVAGYGIMGMAVILMLASGFGLQLGPPTFTAGIATALAVGTAKRALPWAAVKEISWNVLALVAGLFVLVQALAATGVLAHLGSLLQGAAAVSPAGTAWSSGIALGILSNFVNNLPAALIAGHTVIAAQLPPKLPGAVLLGVDIGPNLSVTGSLATILWLAALRREGIEVSAWQFLKLGLVVMPPALALALLALGLG
jgi:arsenical pump membrane protein